MKRLKLLPILLLFLTGSLHAQELPKNQIYIYDDWSGGLNLKHSSLSLDKKYGVIAENVRLGTELKSLSKRDEILIYGSAHASEAITGMHRLYLKNGDKFLIVNHNDVIEVGDDDLGSFDPLPTHASATLPGLAGGYRWQWVTWHNLAIGCDGYNQPIKTNGSDATYLGACYAEDNGAGGGGGDPNGAYTYMITYYTTAPVGYEVDFDQVSNTVTVTNTDIDLSMIPIAPDTYEGETVIGRRVYRSDAGGGNYHELSNSPIVGNVITILTDSDTDVQKNVGDAYPVAPAATYTPPLGRFPLIHKNRLWFAHDPDYPSRDYYSEDASHDVFVTGRYFNIRPDDGDGITFTMNHLGILTISKNTTIQKLYTDKDDPDDWEISDPFSFIGCQAPYTAKNTPLGIFYLAWDGIYKFNGSYSTLISDAVTPTIMDISESNFVNCWGEFHKNIYYLAYTSEETGASENDRVLLLDVITNAYSIDLLSLNAFCTFSSGTDWDVLYGGSSATGAVYAFSETLHGLVHRRHADFTGTWDDMRYIPTRWGGDADSPMLEIARTLTIDDLPAGTINALVGDINREDTEGHYVSQVLNIGAATFDRLYWHETIPPAGGDITFALRSGATAATCSDFTACVATNGTEIFTAVGHGLVDDERVEFEAGTLPIGISDEILYYVVNMAGNNWQVSLTSGGAVVTFTTDGVAVTFKEWSSTYTNAAGSDISGETANDYIQYRIDMSTDDIDYTPNVYTVGGYAVYLTFDTEGATSETTIPLHWRDGWRDLGYSGYVKTLKKIYCFHEGTSGTLTLKFENFEGDIDTFDINLTEHPKSYTERFTTGMFIGELFTLDITESSLNDIKVKKIIVVFDIEPLI